MKKIFLVTVSCFALTSSWAFAMMEDPDKNQLSIIVKQPVTTGKLREYIYKGLKVDEPDAEICQFDDFVEGLGNEVFTKKIKSVQDSKNKKNSFEKLQNNYISSVKLFYGSYNINAIKVGDALLSSSSHKRELSAADDSLIFRIQESYFKAFQNLSNQFLSIHKICLKNSLVSDFEIIEGTQDKSIKTFLFKDKDEYVPFPVSSDHLYSFMSIPYASQYRKQFGFHKGTLIEDNGIFLTFSENTLSFFLQYGKAAENPFTAYPKSYKLTYGYEDPLMDVLKGKFNIEKLEDQTRFITLPNTQEEYEILELLFLEDLMEEKNNNVNKTISANGLTQKFLMQIECELKEEIKKGEEKNLNIEARIEELEEQIINAPKTPTLQNASKESQIISNTNYSQTKQKKKTKGTPGKKQKKKNNNVIQLNNTTQNQQNNESSSIKAFESEKKKKAKELLLTVKKEGRVKFREILSIMNTIRSTATDDKIFNKFTTIGRKGSHINFHLEGGEGLTLVKKHGKEDLTYPAKQVNYFSMRLINAMFSFTD